MDGMFGEMDPVMKILRSYLESHEGDWNKAFRTLTGPGYELRISVNRDEGEKKRLEIGMREMGSETDWEYAGVSFIQNPAMRSVCKSILGEDDERVIPFFYCSFKSLGFKFM